METKHNKIFTVLYILTVAIILITICSQCSPLYPTNFWVDTNTIFTVGRNLDSKVMYRDLYDQKGPWMFFIYYAASFIQRDGFFGLYLIEIAFAFAFLYISFKTLELFNKKYSLPLLTVVATVLYSSKAFMWGGSAEELSLPFNAYALYLVARHYKTDKMPTNNKFIFAGIGAGLIFYIKFSLLGSMFGLVLALLLLAIFNGKIKLFFTKLWYVILGFLISSIIPLAYFIINNAMLDFYTCYIYNNIFLYHSSVTNIFAEISKRFTNILRFVKIAYIDNRNAFLTIALAFVSTLFYTIKKNARYTFIFLLSFICTFVIYSGNHRYDYYEFVFAFFAPLMIIPIASFMVFLEKKISFLSSKYIYSAILALAIAVSIPLTLRWSSSTFLMGVDKSELPQYKFAKIIKSYPKGNILNINTLDGGIFLASGIEPDRKDFCVLNICYDEIMAEHRQAIANCEYMWVYAKYKPINSDKYELASYEYYYFIPNEKTDYFLYKRKD